MSTLPKIRSKQASGGERPPRYRRLKCWIENQIASGDWPVGHRIPPETELMGTHEISRGTVRRALDELEFEGRVRRQAGQGTFITESTPVMHKPCWTLVYRFRHGESADLQGIESVAEEMGAEVVVEYVADSRCRNRRSR